MLTLLVGHLLYGLLVASIGLLAAAVTDGPATAAIVALAVTLGAWVLDFAATGQTAWLRGVAQLSPTAALRTFESGLLALPTILELLLGAIGLASLAAVWLPSGTPVVTKLRRSAAIALAVVALGLLASHRAIYADATEDRRNSFASTDEAALSRLGQQLTITVYLSPDDPRFLDLNRTVLDKLRRLVPNLKVAQGEVTKGLFAPAGDDRYGLIAYRYGDRQDQSRSTNPREILPLIYGLAGLTPKAAADQSEYPGYPLVADASAASLWFFLVLPTLIALAWWQIRRPRDTHERRV
jgi:hypothetical protein